MIVGRIHGGHIELTTPLPREWEGLAVKVEPCVPDDVLPDLEARLSALHALGPMEFAPGERDAMQRDLTALDDLSRSQMRQLADGLR
jgi:hypothetical protein